MNDSQGENEKRNFFPPEKLHIRLDSHIVTAIAITSRPVGGFPLFPPPSVRSSPTD
jgi:hypothetical protein